MPSPVRVSGSPVVPRLCLVASVAQAAAAALRGGIKPGTGGGRGDGWRDLVLRDGEAEALGEDGAGAGDARNVAATLRCNTNNWSLRESISMSRRRASRMRRKYHKKSRRAAPIGTSQFICWYTDIIGWLLPNQQSTN